MLTTASFSVSQMMQMILPTIIALFLFAPFLETPNSRIGATTLVLSGIVLGYLISDPIRESAWHVMKLIPKFRTRLNEYRKRRHFVESNWRFRYLEAQLSKDDREAVDINGYYIIFIQVVSFYLIVYLVLNLGFLITKLISADAPPTGVTDAFDLAAIWGKLKGVYTPVFGGWQIMTIIVIPASLIVITFLLQDYLNKYKQVFLPGGVYDSHGEKYQRDKGNIAASVWGRVTTKVNKDGKVTDQAVPSLEVQLVRIDTGTTEGSAKTDEEGYFQFKDAFAICLEGCRTMKFCETLTMGKPAIHYSVSVVSPTSLAVTIADDKVVPFFPFTVKLLPITSVLEQNKGSKGDGSTARTEAAPAATAMESS